MQNIEAYKELMRTPKKVLITSHHNPDADALGSSLAWARFLRQQAHEVHIVVPSEFPAFLDWMLKDDNVTVYSPKTHQICQKLIEEAEIFYFMDFSSISRLQDLRPLFEGQSQPVVMIDHHLSPDIKPDFQYWNTEASSTAELVYNLIELLGYKENLSPEIGECIYAGIVTDTSSFKHASTTIKAHLITAELMNIGVDTNRVQRLIYDSNTENRLHFLGHVLRDKLYVVSEYRTAYFLITQEEQSRFENRTGDTEGLVNYALSIEDVILAAIFIEQSDGVKISFRSVGDLPANEIAKKYFGGGGHKNAAGCNYPHSLKEAEQTLLNLLPDYKEVLSPQER